MDSYLAVDYVDKHSELLEYAPIRTEMQRMDQARERIRRESMKD